MRSIRRRESHARFPGSHGCKTGWTSRARPCEVAVAADFNRPPRAGEAQPRVRPCTAAVLLVAAALAASCATSGGPPPPPQTPAEQLLANQIYQALNADPIYFFRHVNVAVHNGVADLSGYVWTTDALYRARQIARGVPGVNGVVTSRLELEREGRANGVTR